MNTTLKPINIQKYTITGFYYQEDGYDFRKYLNIKLKDSVEKNPDLMVIMMNPGSSKPENKQNNCKQETLANPDPTQHQIIRVMEQAGFNYGRILNLSDLREAKSSNFYTKIEEINQKNISHSIFCEARKNDFEALYVKNVPVIYAWGVNKKLIELAKNAMDFTKAEKHLGWNKPSFDFSFYHPLPKSHKKQQEWIENVGKLFSAK